MIIEGKEFFTNLFLNDSKKEKESVATREGGKVSDAEQGPGRGRRPRSERNLLGEGRGKGWGKTLGAS